MIDTAAMSRYADQIMAMIREDAERSQIPRHIATRGIIPVQSGYLKPFRRLPA